MQNFEIINKEECVEEESNIPDDKSKVSDVKDDPKKDNVINPEIVNDNTDGKKCAKDDEEARCLENNIGDDCQICEQDVGKTIKAEFVISDVHQKNTDFSEEDGARCLEGNTLEDAPNAGHHHPSYNADKSMKLELVNSDVIAKRRSIIMLPGQIKNEEYDDEEKEGARCLEKNIADQDVLDDDECTQILINSNKILEIFPDVEETYLLGLCYDNNKLGIGTIQAVSEILMKDDYPKNVQLQKYYVAKMKEILPSYEDELLNYLASNIKTEDEFKKFMNETYETEIKEPNPFAVTEVDEELLFNCPCCCEKNLKIDAMVECSKGCYACKKCVVNNMENTYGEGFERMKCLMNCGGKYTIHQLEDFMNPTMFAGIGQLLQQREIDQAKINDLHRCPFCDYAAIVEEVIFNCTQCGNDSCILCQKEPHPSFLCDEVENDDDVLKWTFVENQMSEALFRIKEPNPFEVTEVDEELLLNCPCCCEEDLKIDAMIDCSNGCYACKKCVVRNMEITYGEGFVRMICLMNCGGKYTIDQLEDFMNPTLFAGIGRLLQQREIEEAKINDLHRCPFCDYAAIIEGAIFNCTQCGKDSCILCQKEPHPSFLCDEVEDDDDVRKRTFVENQMSEALFRMCPKCKVKIIKDAGCNRMTCPCGSMMCYVCKAIVSDYSHFNGQGGTNYHLCPLYNDTEEMHAANVRDRAEEAMKEVGGNLKINPTA